jgi:hypothetical protein
MWTHNPRWSWINRFNIWATINTRWTPHPCLPYWVRVVAPVWAARLILSLEKQKHSDLSTRHMSVITRALWRFVRLSGAHIEKREMPGGYSSIRTTLPFQFNWAEMRQALQEYCFMGKSGTWSLIDLYAIGGIFDGNALTAEQYHSLTNQLITQMRSLGIVEYDAQLTEVYGQPVVTMTTRGELLSGRLDVKIEEVPA